MGARVRQTDRQRRRKNVRLKKMNKNIIIDEQEWATLVGFNSRDDFAFLSAGMVMLSGVNCHCHYIDYNP